MSGRNLAAVVRHVVCVLALMWTGIVNGQPFFFFSDTTNYVRAADVAVYVASHGKFSTVWTDRYRQELPDKASTHNVVGQAAPREGVNDLSKGLILGGRSPYIGALMYAGYVLGDFWPFILLQGVIGYLLILLTARRFGVESPRNVTALTLALAFTTSLPTYVSLLLADAFASFGILAFLLLATPGKLSRWEQAFLALVLTISVTAHLTHIMILIGETAALAALALLRWVPKPPRRAWVAAAGAIIVGFASVQLTAFATKVAFGREPQLLPLLTARFIADGPGKAYIDSGCDAGRFVICHIPIGQPHSDALILFGTTPDTGAYMLGNTDQRRLMGEQDVAFAMAVFKHDPLGEAGAMVRNTVRQLLWIDYDGLNQNCFSDPQCWRSLPEPIRSQLRASPSGRGLWPQPLMNALLYVVVIGSLALLILLARPLARSDRARWMLLRAWLSIGFAGMLVCSFFGGAVADPQYRYQGRLIWLVPLMAGIALLLRLQLGRAANEMQPEKSGGIEPNRLAGEALGAEA